MKKTFTLILSLLVFLPSAYNLFSQTKTNTPLSPMEFLDQYFEIRKSFEHKSDSKKPANFSYSKKEGESATYDVDAAVMYKGFFGNKGGIGPVIGFKYNSSSSDKSEQLYTGLIGYYEIGDRNSGMFKIEPNIFFTRDFDKEDNLINVNTMFVPRFPNFPIPIYNLSARKLKYDGTDDTWYFAFNPSVGMAYDFIIDKDRKSYVKDFHTIYEGTLTLKRYFIEFDIFGRFITEFENRKREEKKYGARLNIFLDRNEATSINLTYEKKNKINDSKTKDNFSVGLGIKI